MLDTSSSSRIVEKILRSRHRKTIRNLKHRNKHAAITTGHKGHTKVIHGSKPMDLTEQNLSHVTSSGNVIEAKNPNIFPNIFFQIQLHDLFSSEQFDND